MTANDWDGNKPAIPRIPNPRKPADNRPERQHQPLTGGHRMKLLDRAINRAYVQRAINQLRAEHDQFVREAATRLGTTYWTLAPVIAAADNAMDNAYDIHGEYVFTRYSRSFPSQLVAVGGLRSWEIWYRHGPMTTIPQQTAASWAAAHAKGHAAELLRMQQAVNDQAIAELRRLYPASVKALVNA